MTLREGLHELPELLVKVGAHGCRQAGEGRPLPHPDHHRDAAGEAHDHGVGDETNDGAGAGESQHQQHAAGDQRGELQAIHAVAGGDARKDDDKGPGGARNLQPATATGRDHQSRDDRGVDALLGPRAGGNRKRHRERQGHHANDQAGEDVARPVSLREQAAAPCLHDRQHLPALPPRDKPGVLRHLNLLIASHPHRAAAGAPAKPAHAAQCAEPAALLAVLPLAP